MAFLNMPTNYQIASDVAEDYQSLTDGEGELRDLLREAIINGIRSKLAYVGPFTPRERDELALALYYVRRAHGTEGDNRLRLLAKFAILLGMSLEGETTLKGAEPYG